MGKQRILLAFDEAAILSGKSRIFALADLVQSLVEVTKNMKLVVKDARLRRVALLESRGAEGLPHIHDGQANPLVFLGPQPLEEKIQTLLRTVGAPEPDRAPSDQVAHHDPVG